MQYEDVLHLAQSWGVCAIYFKWRNELWEIMGDFLAMIWDIFPEKDGAIYTLFCYDGTVPSTFITMYIHIYIYIRYLILIYLNIHVRSIFLASSRIVCSSQNSY